MIERAAGIRMPPLPGLIAGSLVAAGVLLSMFVGIRMSFSGGRHIAPAISPT